MSEETPEKRRPGVPKYYYWAKNPPKPAPYQSRGHSTASRGSSGSWWEPSR